MTQKRYSIVRFIAGRRAKSFTVAILFVFTLAGCESLKTTVFDTDSKGEITGVAKLHIKNNKKAALAKETLEAYKKVGLIAAVDKVEQGLAAEHEKRILAIRRSFELDRDQLLQKVVFDRQSLKRLVEPESDLDKWMRDLGAVANASPSLGVLNSQYSKAVKYFRKVLHRRNIAMEILTNYGWTVPVCYAEFLVQDDLPRDAKTGILNLPIFVDLSADASKVMADMPAALLRAIGEGADHQKITANDQVKAELAKWIGSIEGEKVQEELRNDIKKIFSNYSSSLSIYSSYFHKLKKYYSGSGQKTYQVICLQELEALDKVAGRSAWPSAQDLRNKPEEDRAPDYIRLFLARLKKGVDDSWSHFSSVSQLRHHTAEWIRLERSWQDFRSVDNRANDTAPEKQASDSEPSQPLKLVREYIEKATAFQRDIGGYFKSFVPAPREESARDRLFHVLNCTPDLREANKGPVSAETTVAELLKREPYMISSAAELLSCTISRLAIDIAAAELAKAQFRAIKNKTEKQIKAADDKAKELEKAIKTTRKGLTAFKAATGAFGRQAKAKEALEAFDKILKALADGSYDPSTAGDRPSLRTAGVAAAMLGQFIQINNIFAEESRQLLAVRLAFERGIAKADLDQANAEVKIKHMAVFERLRLLVAVSKRIAALRKGIIALCSYVGIPKEDCSIEALQGLPENGSLTSAFLISQTPLPENPDAWSEEIQRREALLSAVAHFGLSITEGQAKQEESRRRRALLFDREVLAISKANLRRWDALLGKMVGELAIWHQGGIEPERLATLISSILSVGLLGANLGVE